MHQVDKGTVRKANEQTIKQNNVYIYSQVYIQLSSLEVGLPVLFLSQHSDSLFHKLIYSFFVFCFFFYNNHFIPSD